MWFSKEQLEEWLENCMPGEDDELIWELGNAITALETHKIVSNFILLLQKTLPMPLAPPETVKIKLAGEDAVQLLRSLLEMRRVYRSAESVENKGYCRKTSL